MGYHQVSEHCRFEIACVFVNCVADVFGTPAGLTTKHVVNCGRRSRDRSILCRQVVFFERRLFLHKVSNTLLFETNYFGLNLDMFL